MRPPGKPERRTTPRVDIRRELQLTRGTGNAVVGRTLDLGPGGARVTSGRPLRIDEEMHFALDLSDGAPPVDGRARVVRQHDYDVYGLRFEDLKPWDRERLWSLAGSWRL